MNPDPVMVRVKVLLPIKVNAGNMPAMTDVGFDGLLTVMSRLAEVDVANSLLPWKMAVMESEPTGKVVVVRLAVPALRLMVPSRAVPM